MGVTKNDNMIIVNYIDL